MGEKWLPVVGYEGLYEVSSLGRVKRVAPGQGTRPGTIIRPAVMKHRGGYLLVGLSKQSVKTKHTVHRLVAEAFHGAPNGLEVRHLNGDPQDNRAENLKWGTKSENAFDKIRHGTHYRGNQNTGKTHCKHGHEFTEENTYRRVVGQGRVYRQCRQCRRRQSREQKKMRRMS